MNRNPNYKEFNLSQCLDYLADMDELRQKYDPAYARQKKIEKILDDLRPYDELDIHDKLMRDWDNLIYGTEDPV